MSRQFFFRILRSQMEAQQMGFQELANKLKLSERAVQTMFEQQDCSFSVMEQMCQILGLKFEELITALPKPAVMIQHLTQQQEIEILSNKKMCAVVLCSLSYWGVQDILERVRIEKAELTSILRKLEAMGFLQVQPDDTFKLMVSKNFGWLPDGPMMRMVRRESENYFSYSFNKPTDLLCSFTAYVTPETHDKLRSQMLEISREYKKQTQLQANVPVKEKIRVAACLATRDWVPSEIHPLFKAKG